MSHSIFVDSRTLQGNTNTASLTMRFDTPLMLPTDPDKPHYRWYCALHSMTCYNTSPNISPKLNNNVIKYTYNGGPVRTVTLLEGQYSVSQINAALQFNMFTNGDYVAPAPGAEIVYDISLEPNEATNSIFIRLLEGGGASATLDLTDVGTGDFRKLLGYNSQIIDSAVSLYHNSDVRPDMSAGVESYLLTCSIVTGSTVNGRASQVLYSESPQVRPGALMSVTPVNLSYLPVEAMDKIETITFKFVDNQQRLLNLRGEPTSVRILLRYMKAW